MEKLKLWYENSPISWQKESRKKLNKVIKKYNYWITNNSSSIKKTAKLLVRIKKDLKSHYANQDGGSGYKEDLEVMYSVISKQLNKLI